MDIRILTVTTFSPNGDQNRVTLNPLKIKMILASDEIVMEKPVKAVEVLFDDSEVVTLMVSELDLHQIESAVGTYAFGFE